MSSRESRYWPAILATACLGACATGGGAARSYERPLLADVTLERLDVVVVVAGPAVASPPEFNVPAFDPPQWDTVLRSREEDPLTRGALVATLRTRLRGAGFEVRFLHGGAATASEAPGGARVARLAPVNTSTAATSTVAGSTIRVASPSPAPSPAPRDEDPLGAEATLRDVLDASEADGVLVVRVYPVDAFYLFEGAGQVQALDPAFGTGASQSQLQRRAVLRSGRLLIGQAFLFDRKSGLRLWTRQIPDFPEAGQLVADSKLLEYGIVTPKGGREPMPAAKAERAADGFVGAMFAKFPAAQRGSQAARAALEKIDPASEQVRQSFLDDSHIIAQVDFGWGLESAGVNAALGEDQPLDGLGTGAIAPSGVLRLTPRLAYQSPGGFTLSAGIPLGLAPNSFSRTYLRDNPSPSPTNPNDIGVSVRIGQPKLVGLEVGAAQTWALSPRLLLRPGAGAFAEMWSFDASPSAVISDGRIYRFGVFGGADLLFRLSEEGSWFVRGGGRGRLGGASVGPLVLGFELTTGVGVFL